MVILSRITLVLIFAILMLFAFSVEATDQYVTKNVNAQNLFTDEISPCYNSPSCSLNYSISGTWAGTVTMQRAFPSAPTTWYDVETFTSNEEGQLFDYERGNKYRMGIKTGDYTSGTAVLRLSK